jgi:hypothetical protein
MSKKEETLEVYHHIEVVTVMHKGVTVAIKLNYDKGELSLVERQNTYDLSAKTWKDKKYVFAGRTLDYINSWQTILEAMSVAIKKGKEMLEHDLAKRTALNDKMIVETFTGLKA